MLRLQVAFICVLLLFILGFYSQEVVQAGFKIVDLRGPCSTGSCRPERVRTTKIQWKGEPVLTAGISPEDPQVNCTVLNRSLIFSQRCGLTEKSILVPFLVTGVGRSGTKFLAAAFQSLDMSVSHDVERIGKEGAVSWMDCFNGNTKFLQNRIAGNLKCRHIGGLADTWRYKHIFHLVRNPLTNIDSRWNAGQVSNFAAEARCQTAADEGLSSSLMSRENYTLAFTLRHWVLFNSFAEVTSEWGFRNEELKDSFPRISNEIRRRIGMGPLADQVFEKISKLSSNTNSDHTKKSGNVTWKKLCEADARYCMMAQLMALRYGYEIDIAEIHPPLLESLCHGENFSSCLTDSLPPKPKCFFRRDHKWTCDLPF